MTQLHVFGLTFNLYGLILGVAILAAYSATGKYAKRIGVGREVTESIFWWVIAGGVIGARLYHVIDKWREIYSLNPKSILFVWNGGLGIWGAVVGGIIAYGIWHMAYGKKYKAGFVNALDVILFGVPLGQAIGRWGNFFNNEIVGKNGEPLFLYESLLDLALFGILVSLVKFDKLGRRGRVVGIYLVGYGLIRFLLERLRPEIIIWKVAGLPIASLLSSLAVAAGIWILIGKSKLHPKKGG